MNTEPRDTLSPLMTVNAATRPPQREHLRAAIAQRGGYCDWGVDATGWVVNLHLPWERTFSGPTLEEALAACLAWLTPAPIANSPVRRHDSLATSPAATDRAYA